MEETIKLKDLLSEAEKKREVAYSKYHKSSCTSSNLMAYYMDMSNGFIKLIEELKKLTNPDEEVKGVCPECGYPKFKKTFEDFERCEGCDWNSNTKN